MNACDVVGYTQDGAFYCIDCFGGDPDSEDVGAVFADSEWDYYPTCDSCGERCEDISLTSDGEQRESEHRKSCDQCAPSVINGVFCHETNCANTLKVWEDGEWVRYRKCAICGYDVRAGENCDCQDYFWVSKEA